MVLIMAKTSVACAKKLSWGNLRFQSNNSPTLTSNVTASLSMISMPTLFSPPSIAPIWLWCSSAFAARASWDQLRSPRSRRRADGGTDFVYVPPGTPSGFPVTQLFSDKRREVDVPLAQRVVPDLNAALLKQFLHIPVTEREAVLQPDRVLDDADQETVAIGHGVSH